MQNGYAQCTEEGLNSISEIWWNPSGTDTHCDSYRPGHWVHWIQYFKSARESLQVKVFDLDPLSDGQADELMTYRKSAQVYFHTHDLQGFDHAGAIGCPN